MSAVQYGKYILNSRARHDATLRVWRPFASVAWKGDKFHYHRLNDFGAITFETDDEALAFGFIAARTWCDKYASDSKD